MGLPGEGGRAGVGTRTNTGMSPRSLDGLLLLGMLTSCSAHLVVTKGPEAVLDGTVSVEY